MKTRSFNGFDLLAPVYDRFARLIFGADIRKAQLCFLAQVPSPSRVLILGGGTGWLLEELLKIKPQCEVWYVESSGKMVEKTRRRVDSQRVHFIQGTIGAIPNAGFDVVITHFFLDLFREPTLQQHIATIRSTTRPSVLWLAADFVDRGPLWQRFMLRVMYIFFRAVCGIEVNKLPDWEKLMRMAGMKEFLSANFFGGFIQSGVWKPEKYS